MYPEVHSDERKDELPKCPSAPEVGLSRVYSELGLIKQCSLVATESMTYRIGRICATSGKTLGLGSPNEGYIYMRPAMRGLTVVMAADG